MTLTTLVVTMMVEGAIINPAAIQGGRSEFTANSRKTAALADSLVLR
ncbi:hypothetical protein [Rhodococcus koreensis]|nr:hypothetical protein [Rhodococcus koreensis]QSE87075.1 hypothetical protein JWS14_49245 [Rhodococcus koreensis]